MNQPPTNHSPTNEPVINHWPTIKQPQAQPFRSRAPQSLPGRCRKMVGTFQGASHQRQGGTTRLKLLVNHGLMLVDAWLMVGPWLVVVENGWSMVCCLMVGKWLHGYCCLRLFMVVGCMVVTAVYGWFMMFARRHAENLFGSVIGAALNEPVVLKGFC